MTKILIAALVIIPMLLLFALPSARQALGDCLDHYAFKAGLVMYVMNPGQARVIDPILTTAAQGYQNNDFVGSALFPIVPVEQRGGKIIEFGKEDFMLYNTGRAPGANTKRVSYGYAGAPYSLEQHALEGQVPIELMQDANAVPGINMGRMAVMKTQNIIALATEKQQADLATNASNYSASNKTTFSGTDQWDNDASKPSSAVSDAIDTVRSKVGKRANTVILGAAVFSALKNHPAIIDRIKYTGREVVTADLLASLWDVKRVLVGDAVFANDAGDFSDVWGKSVVVAYTEIGSMLDMGLPSYGYTYQLRGYPIVEESYYDKSAKSWIYPLTDERKPVIAGALAGYLYSAVIA